MLGRDGGPAFPRPLSPGNHEAQAGMSLRDYFAGQALAGMAASIKYRPTSNPVEVVESAWKLADLMLLAREAQS